MGVAVMDIATGEWQEPSMSEADAVARLRYAQAEIQRLRSELIATKRRLENAERKPEDTRNLDQKAYEWDIIRMQCEVRGFTHPFRLVEAYDQVMGVDYPSGPPPEASGVDLGAPIAPQGVPYLGVES